MNELPKVNLTKPMLSKRSETLYKESMHCHYIYKVQKQTKFILHTNIADKNIED